MISWQTCKSDFDGDGWWRDIYVLQTTIEDWRALCAALSAKYKFEFTIDGEAKSFPPSVDEVFEGRKDASALLQFRAGNILVTCHFFTPDEIEFDIDPREVTSQSDLDALSDLLRVIGNAVMKQVLLTLENCRDNPIMTYDPQSSQLRYHPATA